ncbi:hypothetical protein [Levilactobacillus andaensis]|uniref:hypothetical protein n=1 Tax=Levilactobacillus andaensis TaxID=2799570 RepID=UPI001943CE40|nr:hypothetical protein [Levilactobacillus andaensis]
METYTRYTYYLKKGDDSFVAGQPATETADGLVAVTLYGYEAGYLLENWKKYYWDASGNFTAPEGLPSHSEAVLRMKVTDQASTIKDQQDTIDGQDKTIKAQGTDISTANTTIASLQQVAGKIGGQAAKTSVELATANETISSLQAVAGKIGGMVAKLQVASQATAE